MAFSLCSIVSFTYMYLGSVRRCYSTTHVQKLSNVELKPTSIVYQLLRKKWLIWGTISEIWSSTHVNEKH